MTEASPPSDVAASRIKEIRRKRGFSVAELARRCADAGAERLTENAIENIEHGRRDKDGRRRREITLEELFALAYALDVAPVHLLVPVAGAGVLLTVTGTVHANADVMRAWIRGQAAVGAVDVQFYAREVPEHEYGPDAAGRVSTAYAESEMGQELATHGITSAITRDDATGMTITKFQPPQADGDNDGS